MNWKIINYVSVVAALNGLFHLCEITMRQILSEAVDVKDTFQSDVSSLTEKGGDKLRKLRNTSEIPAHTVSGDTHYTWPCINGLERFVG